MSPDAADIVRTILTWIVLPLWIFAGFADYLCHRAAKIEHASGPRKSTFHLVLQAEIGIPLILAALFQINALVIAVMIVALIAHELTTHADLKLASHTREITPIEQQVHSLLEVLPLTALLLICMLHWDQTLALMGQGTASADFSLIFDPLPLSTLWPWALALLLFGGLPYLEEFVRGVLWRRARMGIGY